MTDDTRVGIGMPVFNGERFIEEAVESILAQSFEAFHLVISDNASTDGTETICQRFVEKDERVQYVRNRTNYGYVFNFNNVFRLSRGQYFKWAAYDDVLGRDFLSRCVAVLDNDPSVVIAYGGARGIAEQGHETDLNYEIRDQNSPESTYSPEPSIRFRRLLRHLWGSGGPFHGVIRSDVLSQTHLHGNFPGGDHVLLAELSMLGRFYEHPEGLFFLRVHPARGSAMSSAKERVAYSDTDQMKRARLESWKVARVYPRRVLGYISAINRCPLSRRDKALCYRAVAGAVSRWVLNPGEGGY